MNAFIYVIAILILGASAVFSYLTSAKHQQYTQDTYDNRKANDALEKRIRFLRGLRHDANLDQIKEEGDLVDKPVEAFGLIYAREIAGRTDPTNMNRDEDREDQPYSKNVEFDYMKDRETKSFAGNIAFVQYNRAFKKQEEGDENATNNVNFVKIEAVDVIQGEAKKNSVDDIASKIDVRISSLKTQISNTQIDVDGRKRDVKGLEDEIKKFVEAEKEIQKEFASEGVTDLAGGKELLETLEARQKARISEKGVLSTEQEALKGKRDVNNTTLASQAEYRRKRKVSLGANSKTFPLAAVDFNWGFVVIKTDDTTKFFINQKLMVLRNNSRHVGDVIISSIEPGRVMANVDYTSVAKGDTFKRGDVAILADPADQ